MQDNLQSTALVDLSPPLTHAFAASTSCSFDNLNHVVLLMSCTNVLYLSCLCSCAPLACFLPCRSALDDSMLL
jgi:hypothetical protein